MLGPAARAARGLLRGHHPSAARGFSSVPDGENSPKFERGYELAAGLWRRSFGRLHKLSEYQNKGAFVDSLGSLAQCFLFIQLQLPKKTTVDLLEFVEGAQKATEVNLRAMNSAAFPEFLADKEKSSPQVAEMLQQFTTPAYYNQMALQVKKNYLHRNFYVECAGVRVEEAQLAQVVYRRLTEEEYEDLVAFTKPPTGMSPHATVEHLRLHVDVATVEDLDIVYLEEKTRHVQHQNVYRVVFESRVTEPEDVDWRIESMHIVEQKAIPRPEDTPAGASDEKKDK
ncbi:hypothetical protein PHYPSEUDO_002628 [Phytophthora pseudosyringae]|uniref:Uncharacterized protein n=1 Tax=Phytophthora pseudosyringae TaxID=221518 RepID=A0A8T1VX21_9STRA|nr:hypothetical protein PHYPSEUDO_002628 [Phytophthora pseudosyringae]